MALQRLLRAGERDRMPRPTTRAELLDQADREFERLFEVVDGVSAARLETPGACETWSVKDLLAHLDAWHRLFIGWEASGASGGTPDMPASGYSWKETPALNEHLHGLAAADAWDDVVAKLRESHDQVVDLIASYSDEDLFTKRRFAWTGSTSVGSYAVSATSSHYTWAAKLIRAWAGALSDS
mgnify:FL=1